MSVEVLKDIRKELKELRLLYKELVEKLIPTNHYVVIFCVCGHRNSIQQPMTDPK